MVKTPHDFVTTSTVARALHVAENTVRLWAARGDLPYFRLSTGQRIFRRQDVRRLLETRAAAAREQ